MARLKGDKLELLRQNVAAQREVKRLRERELQLSSDLGLATREVQRLRCGHQLLENPSTFSLVNLLKQEAASHDNYISLRVLLLQRCEHLPISDWMRAAWRVTEAAGATLTVTGTHTDGWPIVNCDTVI